MRRAAFVIFHSRQGQASACAQPYTKYVRIYVICCQAVYCIVQSSDTCDLYCVYGAWFGDRSCAAGQGFVAPPRVRAIRRAPPYHILFGQERFSGAGDDGDDGAAPLRQPPPRMGPRRRRMKRLAEFRSGEMGRARARAREAEYTARMRGNALASCVRCGGGKVSALTLPDLGAPNARRARAGGQPSDCTARHDARPI